MVPRRPRSSPGRWAAVGAVSLATWVHVAGASAQPTVRIQVGTHLELEGIDVGSAHGRLTNDLGQPLAGAIVVVDARADGDRGTWHRAGAKTSQDGRFHVEVGTKDGEVELSASYAGDRLLAPARAAGRFDASLAAVRLRMTSPDLGRVDLDEASFTVRVVADSRAGAAGLTLSVLDEAGTSLASGTTRSDGSFESELPTQALGPPGLHRLVAGSAADARRGAALIDQALIAFLRTSLTLAAEQDADVVVLQGALSTSRGPLAQKAIGLFADGAHLATVLTDGAGRYHYAVTGRPVGMAANGELQLQARFDSDGAWLASSRSPSLKVSWQRGALSRALWLLAATTLSALLVLGFSNRRGHERRPSAPPPVRGPGIHALGPRARGRAHDHNVGGIVLDARSGQPVAHARVALEGPRGAVGEATLHADGRFAAAVPSPGTWRLTVSASGYASQSRVISIPHHGAWANVQVLLPSLRWAAVEAYRPAAERVLPAPHLWGQWTLREIHDSAARGGRGGVELERATELTELTAYGPQTPSVERIEEIDRVVAEVGLTRSTKNDQSG